MNKYNIEGGINFFEELYKSLDEESEEQMLNDSNTCLISGSPLIERFVKLICSHKFNYIPLYNDLVNHRNKFNNLEGNSTRLELNEIRCPYCRTKDNNLLPYYEELGLPKVNGVNFYDKINKSTSTFYCSPSIFNSSSFSSKCEYELPNQNFDSLVPESSTNKKFILCGKSYAIKIKIYNPENPSEPINYGDTKCYCWTHNKIMIKKYKLQIKIQEKEQKKIKKIQDKEEKKKAKEEAKQKAKEELKMNKKSKTVENIVLGPLDIEN